MKWRAQPKTDEHPAGQAWENFATEVDAETKEQAFARFAEEHGINPTKISHFIDVVPAE